MTGKANTKKAVVAALLGNAAIAVIKLIAAAFTGSTAMLAEGAHSIVDMGNEILLLLGRWRARQKPDPLYPLGRAMEQYFWAFMVSLLVFGAGGGFAVYEGVHRLVAGAGREGASPWWNYAVLAAAFLFEGTTWLITLRELQRERRSDESVMKVVVRTKRASLVVVGMEDTAALVGIVLAASGIALDQLTGWHGWQGVASILIGLLLCGVAVLLARETHSLIVGEGALDSERKRAIELAESVDGVRGVRELLTRYLGPDEMMAALKVAFEPTLSVPELERTIDAAEANIRREMPQVRYIFVEPDSD